jgi:hypothetical protein
MISRQAAHAFRDRRSFQAFERLPGAETVTFLFSDCAARQRPGDVPTRRRNASVKWLWLLLNLKGLIALSRPIFWRLLPLEALHFANLDILLEPYTSMKPSLTATLLRMALQ